MEFLEFKWKLGIHWGCFLVKLQFYVQNFGSGFPLDRPLLK